ncbi:ATP-grasp domain-containing protein [Rhodococcus sp. H29-C3]|uniref:ATP-grasp domain-containing protein n=1 Tax=Rhodococcus sp. H29-C3 TaxID=3046307 RepID=UPI0024B9025E|nr:ATP-grasp domain-containing protein [Rhodococcus sp. H29-C3]MDJ0362272.1 ATP-grasp domain-containing protein [Rhodococcus sp. H29-C3]
MTPRIAIVDGYSTGRLLAPAIHALGGETVHIVSSPSPPAILKRSSGHGAQCALPHAAPQVIARQLQERGIDAVLAGAESGVLFADELCHHLGLTWNVHRLSAARRDKYMMIEELRAAGLLVVQQIRSADPTEIHRWAKGQHEWPIVIKPVMSTSSEDIFFCHNLEQITLATDTIIGKLNYLDVLNTDVLAQTYLDGPIYVVNSVSHHGRHTTSDIWQFDFERTPGKGIRMVQHTLLTPTFDKLNELVDYNNRALTALGIHNGPSHTELKLTPHGPSMIETGARLMGATIEEIPFRRSMKSTQVDLTAQALCTPTVFAAREQVQHPDLPMAIVWVHFDTDGRVTGTDGLRQLDDIASVVGLYGLPVQGDLVLPSSDTTGQHGFIYLQSDNELHLHRDCRRVRRLIRDSALFDLDTRKVG